MKHYRFSTTIVTTLFCFLFVSAASHASNVGGVFGPTVKEGDRTFQYRGAYDPDSYDFVQRIHYQQALNESIRLRGVFQTRKTESSDVDFDFFQGEFQWQLDDMSSNWKHAVRFDARVRDRGRRGSLAVTWTNQIKLSDTLSTTALVLGSVDVGNGSRSGVFLQTRANLSKKLNDRWRLNAELFSVYGSTSDLRSFDDQSHQLGPSVSAKFSGGWGVFSGLLFGVNSASPDESLRFWITKGF